MKINHFIRLVIQKVHFYAKNVGNSRKFAAKFSTFYENFSLLIRINCKFRLSSTILSIRDIYLVKVSKKAKSRKEIIDPLTKDE